MRGVLNQKPVAPIPNNVVAQFVDSSIVEVEEPIYNEKGKVIDKRLVKQVKRTVIPRSVLENEGLSCEMFTIDNLQKAGVDPFKQTPITSPMLGNSIDSVSFAQEQLNDENFINELNNQLNINSNE